SEGTLGTITQIKVKLLRLPEAVVTLMAAFPTVATASHAVSDVIGHGIVPAALEMMDRVTIGAVEAHYRAGYPVDAGAVLLVEVDGLRESCAELAAAIERVLRTNEATNLRTAADPAGGRPQGRARAPRPHPAKLLPARRRGPAPPPAGRPAPGHRDRRALPAAGRQRVPRRRRQPAPEHPVRPPRRRRAGPGRAGRR